MSDYYDVTTPEGLAKAVEWQRALIEKLTDQARWIVPRTGSVIVIDQVNKTATRVLALIPVPESSIETVFIAMGWKYVDQALEVKP